MCFSESPTPSKPSNPTLGGGTTEPCHPTCTLASQTIATSPSNRARTKIGVGEEVTLTVTGNPATWTISGGGTLSPSSGTHGSVTFTADDAAGSVTITAAGSGCSCSNSITFTVVQPSSWTMKNKSGKKKHTNGQPDCGWKGIMYVHPNDVNFYRIETRETDSQSVGTGSFTDFNGNYHGNYGPPDNASSWFRIIQHTDADGSTDNAPDQIYSGYTGKAGTAPPFVVGTAYFPITMQWHVVGNATIHDFPVVRQEHEVYTTGKCETRKGGHTESSMYNDPTSSW